MRHVAKLDAAKPSLASPFDEPDETTSSLMQLAGSSTNKRLLGRQHKHLGEYL